MTGRRWFRIGASLFLVALAASCGPSESHTSKKGTRPVYGMLTGLPLFWGEEGFGAGLGGKETRAPIIVALVKHGDVRAIDAIEGHALRGLDVLVLAQPRMLAPQELTAIDAWVRDGGRLIAFADPLLDWPSRYPLGDKRRAPPVTLLDPLFSHWGLSLEGGSDAKTEMRALGPAWIETIGAGQWKVREGGCQVEPDGLVARCVLGKGQAALVADADLLDGRAEGGDGPLPQTILDAATFIAHEADG